jgi:hypothetical protein
MEFNPELHQKVRYMGQLYVVMLDEFPNFPSASLSEEFVLHPISNDWIVHIISPTVRNLLKVKKNDFSLEEHAVMI